METSPHTRGEPCRRRIQLGRPGNIPAYAGRTRTNRVRVPRPWKHPRIRGENIAVEAEAPDPSETSPHTRGELAGDRLSKVFHGNIPAYAGRTGTRYTEILRSQKHPRIRGENTEIKIMRKVDTETSPHTRGEPQHIELLIPFCTVFSMQALF